MTCYLCGTGNLYIPWRNLSILRWKGAASFNCFSGNFTLTKYQFLSAWIPVRLPYALGRAHSRSLFFRNQFLKKPLKCSLRTSLCAQGCSSHWSVTWAVLPQPQNAALVGILIKRRQNEARRTQCCAHTTHWQLLHWDRRMRSFLPADPTAWEDGSFPSLRLKTGTPVDLRASTLFALEFIVALSQFLWSMFPTSILPLYNSSWTHPEQCHGRRAWTLPGPIQAVTSICMPKKSFPLEAFSAFSWSSCCRKNTRP